MLESQDIVEELHIMGHVFAQQAQVLRSFKKLLGDVKRRTVAMDKRLNDHITRDTEHTEHTVGRCEDLIEKVVSRGKELSELETAADRNSTQASAPSVRRANWHTDRQQLKDLLDLKQQQAGIIEAKLALARANDSVTQGKSIMAFTIVTVFFVRCCRMS